MLVKPTCYASPRLVGRGCSQKGGHGVYAAAAIRRGELLVVFAGSAVERSEIASLPPDRRRLLLQVEEDLYLLSDIEGWADWVNHCCEPNAGLRGQVSLVAMRDIEPGEEILLRLRDERWQPLRRLRLPLRRRRLSTAGERR